MDRESLSASAWLRLIWPRPGAPQTPHAVCLHQEYIGLQACASYDIRGGNLYFRSQNQWPLCCQVLWVIRLHNTYLFLRPDDCSPYHQIPRSSMPPHLTGHTHSVSRKMCRSVCQIAPPTTCYFWECIFQQKQCPSTTAPASCTYLSPWVWVTPPLVNIFPANPRPHTVASRRRRPAQLIIFRLWVSLLLAARWDTFVFVDFPTSWIWPVIHSIPGPTAPTMPDSTSSHRFLEPWSNRALPWRSFASPALYTHCCGLSSQDGLITIWWLRSTRHSANRAREYI